MKCLKKLFKRKKAGMPPKGSFYFRFYKEISQNQLPIKYIDNPQKDSLTVGWFVFDKTLILPDVMVQYDTDTNQWFFNEFDGGHELASFPSEEYLEQKINEINAVLGTKVCADVIALVDKNQIDHLKKEVSEKRFLIYDGNRSDVLKSFCKINNE